MALKSQSKSKKKVYWFSSSLLVLLVLFFLINGIIVYTKGWSIMLNNALLYGGGAVTIAIFTLIIGKLFGKSLVKIAKGFMK